MSGKLPPTYDPHDINGIWGFSNTPCIRTTGLTFLGAGLAGATLHYLMRREAVKTPLVAAVVGGVSGLVAFASCWMQEIRQKDNQLQVLMEMKAKQMQALQQAAEHIQTKEALARDNKDTHDHHNHK